MLHIHNVLMGMGVLCDTDSTQEPQVKGNTMLWDLEREGIWA